MRWTYCVLLCILALAVTGAIMAGCQPKSDVAATAPNPMPVKAKVTPTPAAACAESCATCPASASCGAVESSESCESCDLSGKACGGEKAGCAKETAPAPAAGG